MLFHLRLAQLSILDQLPELKLSDRLTPAVRNLVIAVTVASAALAPSLAHADDQVQYESTATGSDIAKGAGLGAAIGAIGAKLMQAKSAVPAGTVGAVIGAVAASVSKNAPVKAPTGTALQPSPGQQYGGAKPPAPTRNLESHRISQFTRLAERFDAAQSNAIAAQEDRRSQELDRTLGESASIKPVAALSEAEHQANEERNALGIQFLAAYAKAVDMGYSVAPINDSAQRIYSVMKTVNPQSYANLRAQSTSYVDRVNSPYRPKF